MATTTRTAAKPVTLPKEYRKSGWLRLGEALLWLLLIGIAIIEIAPISWMFSTSLRDPKNSFDLPPDFWPTALHWQNYLAVINSPDIEFMLFFWNSLKNRTHCHRRPAPHLLDGRLRLRPPALLRSRHPLRLFLASLMVPATVTLIPSFIIIRSLDLMNNALGAHPPQRYQRIRRLPATPALQILGPEELLDAAKIDGAGYFRVYWQILLPLTGPALSASASSPFSPRGNNFVGPLLFLRDWKSSPSPLPLPRFEATWALAINQKFWLAS